MTTATLEPKIEIAKANGSTQSQLTPAQKFRSVATNIAGQLLREWVGEERAREAVGRISAALAASAAAARDPSDFYACTPASIATCVAIAALTGLMPGVGPAALAYVVPQRARKDEAPQLQYSLSHRGMNALARRCGQTMIAVPVSVVDIVDVNEDGDVKIVKRDIDNPPTTFEELRGIIIIVKELSSGQVVARGWMPKKLIEKRRAMSRSWNGNGRQYSPWANWPVEQSMKTGMHYAIARGWCVIDDTEATRALSADQDGDLLLPGPIDSELPRIDALKSKSDELAARLAKPAEEVHSGEEPQEKPDGAFSDAVPYWLGLIAETKDKPALMRKHERFDGIRSDLTMEQQETIDVAFAERLKALTDS